jgi:hypothetical protein
MISGGTEYNPTGNLSRDLFGVLILFYARYSDVSAGGIHVVGIASS